MTLFESLIRLFSHFSRRRCWQLCGLLVLMLAGAVAEMASLGAVIPFLSLLADPELASKFTWLGQLANTAGGSPENITFYAAIVFAAASLLAGALRIVLMWFSLRVTFGMGADLGGEVYKNTLHQPYSWHVSHNTSEVLAGVDKVNTVVYNVINPLIQGLVAFVFVICIVFTLLLIDTQIALLAGIGFSLVYGLTTLLFNRHLVRNSRIISENLTHRVQAIQEGLGGIRDVLLDGTQSIYHQRFARHDYAMRRGQASNALIGSAPRYVIESIGMVLIAALAFWLTGQQGGLAVALPMLGALAIGAQKMLPQMQLLYYSWSSVSGHRDQLADTLKLLDNSSQNTAVTPKPPLIESKTHRDAQLPLIALRDVSFKYKADTPQVLSKISLEIKRGACIGFIGKTGSGKSTLVDLIMGLLEPSAGQIEVNGELLRQANRRYWQDRIAHVPQVIYLSDATIAENIAFGVPVDQIDIERVRVAATQAQLSGYIETLPQKYQTRVGERGVRLSGGQRQRIGLARALYKHADVLVLDEATSALDHATEQSVMSVIHALEDQLTVLIIAHRVTTLRDCDFVVELDHGSVKQIGSYESVIGHITTAAHFESKHVEDIHHA